MKAIVVTGVFLLILLVIFSAGLAVSLSGKIPQKTSPRHVSLENNKLYIDGEEFFVKGVTYSPVPVGEDPRKKNYQDWLFKDNIYKSDFAMMKIGGVNTIRLLNMSPGSTEVRLLLDAAEDYDIKVIMTYPGPLEMDAGDPEVRAKAKKEALDMVDSYKNHPAILMWMIGNEVNYWYPKDGDVRDWYTLLEEISADVKKADPNHPVVTANNAFTDIEHFTRISKSVDIYGSNLYALNDGSWEYFYETYKNNHNRRPILITEFGADSWNSLTDEEDEDTQARLTVLGWRNIEKERLSIGGLVFEWSDEWWKSDQPLSRDCQKDWQPFDKANLPDGWFSEECFGMVRQHVGTYEKTPKKVYYELQKEWSDPSYDAAPTVSYVKIDRSGNIETSIATYGGVGANVTLYYKTLFSGWESVQMQRQDWRYTTQIPDTFGILTYKVIATDIYQRTGEKEGKFFTY